METNPIDLESLLTDGLFDISSYQRSYSWTEPQLTDLFEDLLYLLKRSPTSSGTSSFVSRIYGSRRTVDVDISSAGEILIAYGVSLVR